MSIKEVIREAALQLNLPQEYVWKVYKNYWKSIREFMSSLQIKDITEEEFEKLQTSVNIPSLGKFYIDFKSIKHKKDKYEIYKNKKTETSVLNSTDNS